MTSYSRRERSSSLAEIFQIIKKPNNKNKKIIVVEGTTDLMLFSKLLYDYDEKIIIPPYRTNTVLSQSNNKGMVIDTVTFCNQNKSEIRNRVIGIVDADFMHVLGTAKEINNLVYTRYHDIDIEIFSSEHVMNMFVQEFCPDSEIETDKIIKLCLNIAVTFGFYLFLLEKRRIFSNERRRNNFAIESFIQIENSIILDTTLIEKTINNNWNIDVRLIHKEFTNLNASEDDQLQFANGHHFFFVLWELMVNNFFGLSSVKNLEYRGCELKLKIKYSNPKILDGDFFEKITSVFKN